MKKLFAKAICCMLVTTVVHAQEVIKPTPEDSVRMAVAKFAYSFGNSDGRSYVRSFTDSTATIETIVYDRRGVPQVKKESMFMNANAMAGLAKGMIEEKTELITVKTDGPLAHAWVPYKFYYNGKVQYCGVQSFHFIRLFGFWLIYYMVETRYTNKCG